MGLRWAAWSSPDQSEPQVRDNRRLWGLSWCGELSFFGALSPDTLEWVDESDARVDAPV